MSPARHQRRREQAEKKAHGSVAETNHRAWWWGGGIAATLAVAGIAIWSLAGGGATSPPPTAGHAPAGTKTYTETGRDHVTGKVVYDHTPPVGGNHNSVWLNCGVYDQPVPNENTVHSLEHGSVWITYLPSLRSSDVDRLRTLVEANYDGADRYVILSPYPGQAAPVMASAWGEQLAVQSASDPTIAQFIGYFRQGPQDLERGAACSGGFGTPIV